MVKTPRIDFDVLIEEDKLLMNFLNINQSKIADPMIFCTNRLATFKNWPFKTGSCTAEHMAYAGYHVVDDDCAKCVFCFKELDGWEVTDDPWEQHKSHKPDCSFIKLNKRNISTWSMEEFIRLNHEVYKNKMLQQMAQEKEEALSIFDEHIKESLQKAKTMKFNF